MSQTFSLKETDILGHRMSHMSDSLETEPETLTKAIY